MRPKKLLVIFVLFAFLLPGFKTLAASPATCAIHGKRCAATCKTKKTCPLQPHHRCMTKSGMGKFKKADNKTPSFKGCRHNTSPESVLSVKELPQKRFFTSLYLRRLPEIILISDINLYKNHRPMVPEKPPQQYFS